MSTDASIREGTSRVEYAGTPRGALLISDRSYSLLIAVAILLGTVVRARFVLASDFPLNDGGLFLVMSKAIGDAHYSLPSFVTYNSIHIPFGYSPLSFYVAAGLNGLTGMSLTDTLRFLPLAVTSVTIVAFYLFARDVLTSRVAVVAAVFAFALVPRSFEWLLMGGGLTRSFGLLFAILALHQAFLFYTRGRTIFGVFFGMFAALTALSHLGTAPFLLSSAVILFLAYGRTARAFVGSVGAALLAIALSAPWWATVVAAHGFAPFTAAGATGGTLFSVDRSARMAMLAQLARFATTATSESFFPLIGVLAVAGTVASISAAELYLPAWWVATLVLDARAGATYAMIPASLLAGVAVAYTLVPLTRGQIAGRITGAPTSSVIDQWRTHLRRSLPRWLPLAMAATLVAYAAAGALVTDPDRSSIAGLLVALPRSERSAMHWVATSTSPSSRFLVVAPQRWSANKTGEWFPVLANRTSVATVQGTEWLPNHAFARAVVQDSAVQACATGTVDCIDRARQAYGLTFTHVFVPKSDAYPCCGALRTSLRNDPRFRVIYDGPGATIAELKAE